MNKVEVDTLQKPRHPPTPPPFLLQLVLAYSHIDTGHTFFAQLW